MVGINGKIQTSPSRFLIQVNMGVGYAVPSNQIARFLEPLKKAGGGVVRRGVISGLGVTDETGALLPQVSWVREDSPADRDGFRRGDRVLAIDGLPVWSARRFSGLLATYPAESTVSVRVKGDGGERMVTATLDPQAPAWLGITGETATSPAKGVVLRDVIRRSPAQAAGLEAGDTVVALDGSPVDQLVDLSKAVSEHRAGDTVKLKFIRDGKEMEREVRLEARPDE